MAFCQDQDPVRKLRKELFRTQQWVKDNNIVTEVLNVQVVGETNGFVPLKPKCMHVRYQSTNFVVHFERLDARGHGVRPS